VSERQAVLDLLRVVTRRRRLLAAALVALAVGAALPVLAPAAPGGVPVLTAARDLPAGAVLATADLVSSTSPSAPDGALDRAELEGRLLAGPVRRGEVVTDVRLVGRALLDGLGTSLVATPVRLADPASALLLRSGDVVDVLAASTREDGPGYAEVVAAAARVVAVPAAAPEDEGALVVVAVPERTASRLAASAVSSRLSVVVRA
jgi:Flp pilus assembly protein CpaB